MQDLNVLLALLEERHVSRAAKRLSLSQPAVSHALRRLRDQLGDALLVRTGEGFVLTKRAEQLQGRLKLALEQLEAVLAEQPSFDPRTSQRTFTIASSDYSEFVMLPQIMRRLSREAPGIDLVSRRYNGTLGDVDMAMIVDPPAAAGMKKVTLHDDRFVVMMSQRNPLAKKRLTVDAYANAKHAFIAPAGTRGGAVDLALQKVGRARRVALMLPHFLMAPFAVAESDLILTVGRRIALAYSKQLPLKVVEPPLALPKFAISLVWHERFDADPAHVWLRALVKRAAPR